MLQKFIFTITVIVLISSVLVSTYIYLPQYYNPIDNKIKDILFVYRGEIPQSNNVVIVDIDEKSLSKLGQWPWERNVIANLISKLSESGAGLIGFDIMFPEKDKTSPSRFATKFKIPNKNGKFQNYDLVLGETVSKTPTILGYTFEFGESQREKQESPFIPATFIENNLKEDKYILKASNVILNIPEIQDNSYSSGFFNNTPDSSGIVRTAPLLIKYDDEIFPSLALEMLRIATNTEMVNIDYDEVGVAGIGLNDSFIPTDRYGRLLINYRGAGKTFKYISASDIIESNFKREDVEGKYILIGSSAAGLLDIRSTPFDNYFAGVEVHANIIDNVLTGDFLSKPSWVEGADMLLIVGIVTLSAIIFSFSSPILLVLSFISLSTGLFYGFYKIFFDYGISLNMILPFIALIFTSFIVVALNFFFERKQKQLIKSKFSAKVSPHVMEDLIKNKKNIMIGQEREITVMFSDVRNFTNISESMPNAKTLIEFLNEYMNPMTEIIMKHGGTVDKFIGDAIMAYWNAPIDVADHVNKSVIATLEQIHTCIPLNEKIKKDPRFTATCKMAKNLGKEPIEIGIGLNSGVAVVGEMGSQGRSDYTVIGDPVNLGARLESLCKYYNSLCNVSNFTKDKLDQDKFIFRFLDLVTVKGKTEPIEIWQIHDFQDGFNGRYLFKVSKEEILKELETYHKGIQLYKKAKFKTALEIFTKLENSKNKTNKNIYKIYIERCEHYIEFPPTNFNGVFQHTTKG